MPDPNRQMGISLSLLDMKGCRRERAGTSDRPGGSAPLRPSLHTPRKPKENHNGNLWFEAPSEVPAPRKATLLNLVHTPIRYRRIVPMSPLSAGSRNLPAGSGCSSAIRTRFVIRRAVSVNARGSGSYSGPRSAAPKPGTGHARPADSGRPRAGGRITRSGGTPAGSRCPPPLARTAGRGGLTSDRRSFWRRPAVRRRWRSRGPTPTCP